MFFDGYWFDISLPSMILYWFGSLFTVSANLLLCVAYWKDPFRELQTVQNFLVLNLGIADLIMGAVAEPLLAITYWNNSDSIYLAHYLFAIISGACSLLNITALATVRYFAVKRPLQLQNIVNRNSVLTAIAVIWGISLHYALIALLGWRNNYFQIYLYGLGCILPTLVFMIAYYKVYRAIRQRTKIVERLGMGRNAALKNAIRSEKAATKTVLLVLVIFISLWVPFLAIDFVMVQCTSCRSGQFHLARDIALTLVYFSSGINPLVYAWRVKSFRRAFVRVTGFSKKAFVRRGLSSKRDNKIYDEGNGSVSLTAYKHVNFVGMAVEFNSSDNICKSGNHFTRY